MNDDTIKMVRESKLDIYGLGCPHDQFIEKVKAFEALVRADERKIVMNEPLTKAMWQRFADEIRALEREAIMDEWWMCVQSDLENGVKSLNERAAEKWKKEYPEISKFAATIEARGHT